MAFGVAKRSQMPFGQITHMDIVAHTRAVGRIVVVSEDGQLFAPADGHLRNVRHQVVGRTVGVFPDQARFMRAHGIEIAQQHQAELRVCHSRTF